MRSRLKLCIAMAFALSAMQAQAIGLGAIEVKSKLDQPFVAEIPVTINSPDEANGLVVRLASADAFARVGMNPNQLSANLEFSVGKNARGETIVRVTTPQRMHDPYVTFLLEADWGKGKMVREYTALLDPPHTAEVPRRAISAPVVASTPMPAPVPVREQPRMQAPPPIQPAAASPMLPTHPLQAASPPPPEPPQPVAETPPSQLLPPLSALNATEPEPAPAPPQPIAVAPAPEVPPQPIAVAPAPEMPPQPMAAAPAPEVPSQPFAAAPESPPPAAVVQAPPPPAPEPMQDHPAPDSVTVAHGDTLSGIAGQVRPGDVSLNRMMIALQRENPDAFIRANINLLKSGTVLHIPGSEQTEALTAEEADTLVHEQIESWRQDMQPVPQLQPAANTEPVAVKPSRHPHPAAGAVVENPSAPAPVKAAEPDSAAQPQPDATVSAPRVARRRGARLEIVPPIGNASQASQSGASEGGSGSELRAQLAQTREELAARNSEVGDLKSRVADLEKMQKDSQKLLSMKDSELAAMQQRLAQVEKNNAAASAAAASTTSSSAAPPAPAAASTVAETAAASKPAVHAAKKPTLFPPAPDAEEPTPWYMRPLVLVGMLLLILAALLGMMLRRPRDSAATARPRGFVGNAQPTGPAAATVADTDLDDEEAVQDEEPPALIPQPPKPPPPQPSGKPQWSGGFGAAPSVAAPIPPGPPAADVAAAAAMPAGEDWPIDETPAPTLAAEEITKQRAAVPDFEDSNQTVATKLELARAYIDIGDSDGARGMLEEVLIEGNSSQQEAAFKLLDTLDG